ncbi:MAG: hypothetical protein C0410_00760 [Anaerolinea sp.]|nr:hypothetical protein [Anaerolinea sp.]
MKNIEFILERLNGIGDVLSKRDSALALIALGSVGIQLDRMDQYSDLDFFVIVKTGCKPQYLEDLSWLKDVAEVGYCFQNTQDGYKLLFADGVFCEFAVFDEDELKNAVFTKGRIVWKADGVSDDIAIPQRIVEKKERSSTEWLIGEAVTNLYVGLCREKRGEKLSAMRFIQGYAVDRVLELSEMLESATLIDGDEFNIERRYEQRYPASSKALPEMLQGYEKNRESAISVVSFLEEHYTINPFMKQAVLDLCS